MDFENFDLNMANVIYNKTLLQQDLFDPDSYVLFLKKTIDATNLQLTENKNKTESIESENKFIDKYEKTISDRTITGFWQNYIDEYKFAYDEFIKNEKIVLSQTKKMVELIESYSEYLTLEEKQNFTLTYRRKVMDMKINLALVTSQIDKLNYLQAILELLRDNGELFEANKKE